MSEQPDLSTLPQRMRYAAAVLLEARKEYHNRPENLNSNWIANAWDPTNLRHHANEWEAANELESEVEELAQEIHAARWPKYSDPTNGAYLPDYRKAARKLIEAGWRKGDPE